MRKLMCFLVSLSLSILAAGTLLATDFGPAENALGACRSIRYESVYTKVPTTGKLVSIKITDNGKVYYICKEKTGFVIYNLEIRPSEAVQEKIQQELKKKARSGSAMNPDELVVTKEILERESKKQLAREFEAVWIRNEIVIEPQR
jgi:hypothetical protein